MGLRINTNINSLVALGKLQASDRQLSTSIERLSSGLRINKASDDPAGMVISEQLRAQIGGLEQAVENTTFSSNLIGTTEAALQEVSDLLIRIRDSAILAGNTGGLSNEQIKAEQDSVDSALNAIDRIASTTRFARRNLLNGASDFVTSGVNANVQNVNLRSVFFGNASAVTFTAVVTQSANRAVFSGLNFSSPTGGTLRITGSLGSEDIVIANSAVTATAIGSAITKVREFTGVYGSGALILSEEFGSDQVIKVEVIAGNYGTNVGGIKTGQDVGVTIAGAQTTGDGLEVAFNSKFVKGNFRFTLTAGTTPTTQGIIGVRDSGLTFQLGGQALATDEITVGIRSVSSQNLGFTVQTLAQSGGTIGGFLSSVLAGGTNDLTNGPENAVRILDKALDQVNGLRSFLGSVDSDALQPNARALSVAIENLTASESTVRDLDFARETASFTRAQVLFNAGTSVLATANLLPQTVLGLLG